MTWAAFLKSSFSKVRNVQHSVLTQRSQGRASQSWKKKKISNTYSKEKTIWITNHKQWPHGEVWGPYKSWQDYQERPVLFSSAFPVHTAETETKGQKRSVENKNREGRMESKWSMQRDACMIESRRMAWRSLMRWRPQCRKDFSVDSKTEIKEHKCNLEI